MTPEDRDQARALLLQKLLTIEQVTEIRKVCDRTGRPFAEVAARSGLHIPAPRRSERFWLILAATFFAVVAAGFALSKERSKRDEELDRETAESMERGHRLAEQARIDYQHRVAQVKLAAAGEALLRARTGMALAEERLRQGASEDSLQTGLLQAIFDFKTYLDVHSSDAAALSDRSRAYELSRLYEKAAADLETAIKLQPELASSLRPRLDALRRAKRP